MLRFLNGGWGEELREAAVLCEFQGRALGRKCVRKRAPSFVPLSPELPGCFFKLQAGGPKGASDTLFAAKRQSLQQLHTHQHAITASCSLADMCRRCRADAPAAPWPPPYFA